MTTANSGKGRRKPPSTGRWKKGQSGNPAGAPKRGESWAEVIRDVGNMTGEEVAVRFSYLVRNLKQYPKGVTLKELVVIRAFAALANEPSASLMGQLMDRTDGKVPDQTQVDGKLTILGFREMLEKVYGTRTNFGNSNN